jgi:hypothetical protein
MRTTSTNYSGRLVDMLVFQNTNPSGKQRIEMTFGEGGLLTTGVQKVAQTFTTILLTDKGTVYDKPDYGTDFVRSIQNGTTQTEDGLKSSFSLAVADVKRIMSTAALDNSLPEDEQLEDAELLDYALDKASGKIGITVGIVTVAGPGTTIYIPVSVPIR